MTQRTCPNCLMRFSVVKPQPEPRKSQRSMQCPETFCRRRFHPSTNGGYAIYDYDLTERDRMMLRNGT